MQINYNDPEVKFEIEIQGSPHQVLIEWQDWKTKEGVTMHGRFYYNPQIEVSFPYTDLIVNGTKVPQ